MKTIYNLLIILMLPLSLVAQTQTITIEKCREMALEHSFNLKSAKQKILISEDMLKAYKTNYLPNFSANASYLYSTFSLSPVIEGGYLPTFSSSSTGELTPNIICATADGTPIFSSYAYMPDTKLEIEVGSFFTAGLQLSQAIYTGGKISTATKMAKLGVEAAKLEQELTEAEVSVLADQAFYSFLKVEDMLRAADAYLTVVEELYRQVESMLKRGMCTKNDLMRVQVKVNEAKLQQLKAKNGVILARMNLCHVIGLPLTTQHLDVVDTFNMQQNIDISLDVTLRPEYQLLKKSVEAKELEVKLSASDFRPTISALANYGYSNGLMINGSRSVSPSFTGGVAINIPIFHWGEGRRKISAARHQVKIAENTQEDLIQKMTLELMQSINAYNEAQAEVMLMEGALAQATENMRQSTKQYQAGVITLSINMEAHALWQKAMSDLTEAKANQRLAYSVYCRSKSVDL